MHAARPAARADEPDPRAQVLADVLVQPRGDDRLALHWAYELDASGPNWLKACRTRLLTIAYEDVGIADMVAVDLEELGATS